MNQLIKKIGPDVIAIVAFILIAFAYFYPADIDGRVLTGSDHTGGAALGMEASKFKEETGKTSRWTSVAFGGMPTYQISPSYPSSDLIKGISKAYQLGLPGYVGLVFIMLLGFYILMRAFNFKVWIAALGAILWAFSSYYFIIILAGHIWKFITLAYIPPTIAGIALTYKGKYIWGGILTAFFVAMQIISNHVQMSYYFLFVIFFMVIAYFVEALRNKQLPRFFKATGIVLIAGIIGVMVNSSNLYHTWEYSKHTMRGKSELVKPNTQNQTSSGLERDYITQWSYGIGETFSLMIPNVKGGASVPMAQNQDAMKNADPNLSFLYQQIGQYWGEQPGTSGPVYVGAFVMMLFILGIFIVKGPMKWALLGATVLSILLSWGHNFMGFTDLFIDYVPMYAKFRTVASILVIAEFTIPLLAIMALAQWLNHPEILKDKKQSRYFYLSFAVTGGLCLLFALLPNLFFDNYVSTSERNALQGAPQDQLIYIINDLTKVREGIFTADAWRSFFIILIGTAFLWAYAKGKLKGTLTVAGITILCLWDMWSVNKRYLNDSHFVEPQQQLQITKSAADEQILQDKDPDYRVLDFSVNTFNDNATSFFHKSIGGYHPAKLRRYQEMIEYHISQEMPYLRQAAYLHQGDLALVNPDSMRVLNMLNTRYIILPLQDGQKIALRNPYALGNAWFVDKVDYVKTANEEIESLHSVQPAHTAVVAESYRTILGTISPMDSTARIKLTTYEPNRLVYESHSEKEGIAVFSEIYYPGWTATIDGKETEIACADYILRALRIPAGTHTLEFTFDPQSIHTTETIAYIGIVLLILGVVAGITFTLLRMRKEEKTGK